MTALAIRPFGTRWDEVNQDSLPRPTQSAVFGPVIPAWRSEVARALAQHLSMPRGWDGHGGEAISRDTAVFGLAVLETTLGSTAPAPHVTPMSHGGIQFEWHYQGCDIEVEVAAPFKVSVFVEIDGQAAVEEELESSFGNLAEIFKRLLLVP